MPPDRQSTKQDFYWAIAIFSLSLAIRLTALWMVSDVEIHFPKYLILAERLQDNHFIAPEVFAYCPLYVYFLAFLLTITGGATFPVLVVQVILGSFGTVVAYYIARTLSSRRTAVIAGLIFAFSGSMVLHEVNFLADALGTLLELLLLAALLRAFKEATLKRWALCGLILGLSTILRPNIALALVGLVPAIWILLRSMSTTRKLARAGVLVGMTVAVTLPITLQNAAVGKDFVPVLSTGGYVFYASNNYASSAVRYAPPPLLPAIANARTHEAEDPVLFWDDSLSATIAHSWGPENLKPSEVSGFYLQRAMDPVRRYPGYFLVLMLRKGLGIASAYEVHDTLEANAKKNALFSLPLIPYGWLFCLGAIGVFVTRRYRRLLLPLYILAGTQIVTLLLFYVVPRFRLPLEAMLALFAALAVAWWLESPRLRALRFFVPLGILLVISYVPRTDVMRQIERDQGIQSALAEGEIYASSGDYANAIEAVNRLIELVDNPASPLLPDAHRQLAELYRRSGRPQRALEETENAQPLPPLKQAQLLGLKIQEEGANSRLLCLMSDIYMGMGRWSVAKDYCTAAVDLTPENPTIRYHLAEIQMAAGQLAAAVSNLELALKDGLDFTRFGPGAHYHLWQVYREHDPDAARIHRQAFRRLSWIFRYLQPTPAEIQAMKEMDLPNP
ncbi:MAG: glycosyltransferase family 39 protein [Candidatus Eisenbacteria sp.]|nr:glycosyltransferase family 39 protein [Candidatus Eisenbacteria bacterium]